MREGIGEAFLLGCSAQFGSTFGIVDGLRTGGDVNPRYDAFVNRCLQNGGNFYLNHKVVQGDADYLVLRNKDDEEADKAWGKQKFGGDVTLNEAKMWADYVTLFGGIKLSSDNLKILRDERKELVKNAFSINSCTRYIPIDFWDKAKHKDDAFNIMLGENDEGVYLALFNWSDAKLGIQLSKLPTSKIEAVNYIEKPIFSTVKSTLNIKLKARTSVIFKLQKGADFDKVRKQLVYEFNK
jgi:alpha-galactosidase